MTELATEAIPEIPAISPAVSYRQNRPFRYWQSVRGLLRQISATQWLNLAAIAAGFILLSVGFSYLSRYLMELLPLSSTASRGIVYLGVAGIFFVSDLSLFVPVPITTPVIIAGASVGSPLLVGLAAAIGGSFGEVGGYLAGRMGHNVLAHENFMCKLNARFCNSSLQQSVEKRGMLAILIMAAQPIIPFDFAGIVAGSVKMNFHKFYVALVGGRIIKYVMLAYMAGFLVNIPFFK